MIIYKTYMSVILYTANLSTNDSSKMSV